MVFSLIKKAGVVVRHLKGHPINEEGYSTNYFSIKVQNVYSEVASKEPRKPTASKYTLSYQNNDLKK